MRFLYFYIRIGGHTAVLHLWFDHIPVGIIFISGTYHLFPVLSRFTICIIHYFHTISVLVIGMCFLLLNLPICPLILIPDQAVIFVIGPLLRPKKNPFTAFIFVRFTLNLISILIKDRYVLNIRIMVFIIASYGFCVFPIAVSVDPLVQQHPILICAVYLSHKLSIRILLRWAIHASITNIPQM